MSARRLHNTNSPKIDQNDRCFCWADTRVRPYGGQGSCLEITRHVMSFDCPVRRQFQGHSRQQHRRIRLRITLAFDCRGRPVCPPSENIMRFSPIFGEFVMPTMSRHTDPPLRPRSEISEPVFPCVPRSVPWLYAYAPGGKTGRCRVSAK